MPLTKPRLPVDVLAINAALVAVRQAAQVLCDRASLLLLLCSHAGLGTYTALATRSALPSKVLSARLAQLVADGLLVRMPYALRPLRYAYHLSYMGQDLFDVLALCAAWEEAQPSQVARTNLPVRVQHLGCTQANSATSALAPVLLHCAACNSTVGIRDVLLRVHQKQVTKLGASTATTRRSSMHAAQPHANTGPLAQSLVVLGDKWAIELLVCAFFGVRQFSAFAQHTGIASNILTDRLERLVQVGLLSRASAEHSARTGSYLLTDKGRAFYPVVLAIQRWADAWLAHRIRSPVKLVHSACGKTLMPQLVCMHCAQTIDSRQGHIAFVD